MEFLQKLDRNILKCFYMLPYRETMFVKFLIFIGDGPFWLLVLLLSSLTGQIFEIESLNRLSIMLMIGFFISNYIFTFLKTFIKRKRPYANPATQALLGIKIINRDKGHGSKENESFPSGHALWTTLSVSLICFQYGLSSFLIIGWLIPVILFLRLYLGVHYPSDTLAGALLGIVVAISSLLLTNLVFPLLYAYYTDVRYIIGYWLFLAVFLFLGMKSWLKRVREER